MFNKLKLFSTQNYSFLLYKFIEISLTFALSTKYLALVDPNGGGGLRGLHPPLLKK
jgi:hypothetical protein